MVTLRASYSAAASACHQPERVTSTQLGKTHSDGRKVSRPGAQKAAQPLTRGNSSIPTTLVPDPLGGFDRHGAAVAAKESHRRVIDVSRLAVAQHAENLLGRNIKGLTAHAA